VRANVEYADYPYARFDVSLDRIGYSDDEYRQFLSGDGGEGEVVVGSDGLITDGRDAGASATTTTTTVEQRTVNEHNKNHPWTKSETDTLMELCHKYDLRWPVIIDRWHSRFNNNNNNNNNSEGSSIKTKYSMRKVEDLQFRYYQVGNILNQKRLEAVMAEEVAKLAAAGGGGDGATTNVVAGSTASSANAAGSSSAAGGETKPPPTKQQTDDSAASQASSNEPPPLDKSEIEALQNTAQLATINPTLTPNLSIPGTGTSHRAKPFDLEAERARRRQLDHIWNRSKEEEREEEELRAELRAVEAQLRKMRKMGKHLDPAGAVDAAPTVVESAVVPSTEVAKSSTTTAVKKTSASVSSSPSKPPPAAVQPNDAHFQQTRRNASSHAIATTDPYFYNNPADFVEASFNATAPVPTPGTPYLQSGRLFPPAIDGHIGLNKSTLKQMDAILNELGVPKEPIATRRNCDLYDNVRKDALTLLTLQKMVLRKEAEVLSKRTKLCTLTGAPVPVAVDKKNATKGKSDGSDDGVATVPVLPIGAASGATATQTAKKSKSSKAAKRKQEEIAVSGVGTAGTAGKKAPAAAGPAKKKARKKSTAKKPPAEPVAHNAQPSLQPPVAASAPTSLPANDAANTTTTSSVAAAFSQVPNPSMMIPTPISSIGKQSAGKCIGKSAKKGPKK